MTDQPLAMPTPPQKKPKTPKTPKAKGLPVFTLALCLLALKFVSVCSGLYWLLSGRVEARSALLEGTLVALPAPITAQVLEVVAPEGALVAQGQVIARLQAEDLRTFEAEARSLLSNVPHVPSIEEGAARVMAAQSAEEQMAQRFALARHEELARQRIYEHAVLEHVRSELLMRGLETGRRATSAQAREQASRAEVLARQRMEQAKDAFEQASRGRAAVEQELRRLRSEWEAARARGVAVRPAQTQSTQTQVQHDSSLIRAPRTGRVVGSLTPGQLLVRGETAVSLAPADGTQIWVTAQARRDQAVAVRPGTLCLIRPDNINIALYGEVYEILDISSTNTGPGVQVPLTTVRIRLLQAPSNELAAHLPGRAAQITLWTHDMPGLALLLPYIGPALALVP